MPQIIYLTGAPVVGKTTIALQLAAKLSAYLIQTDLLKYTARQLTTDPSNPIFFNTFDYYRQFTTNITEQYKYAQIHSDSVIQLLKPIIDHFLPIHQTLLIEGAHLIPQLLASDDLISKPHHHFTLGLEPSIHRELIIKRGLVEKSHQSLADILNLQKNYLQSKQTTIINNTSIDESVDQIINLL